MVYPKAPPTSGRMPAGETRELPRGGMTALLPSRDGRPRTAPPYVSK